MGPCFGTASHFNLEVCGAFEGIDFLQAGSTGFIFPPKATRAFTTQKNFNISELEIFKVDF